MKKKLAVIGFLFALNYGTASDFVEMPRDQAIEELSIAVSKLIEENKELRKALDIKLNDKESNNSVFDDVLAESSYVISTPLAKIYERNSVYSSVVRKYEAGELFFAQEINNDWLYIKDVGCVKKTDAKKVSSLALSKTVIRQTKNLRVKPYLRKNYIVAKAIKGQELEFYDFRFNGNWYLTKEGNYVFDPRN